MAGKYSKRKVAKKTRRPRKRSNRKVDNEEIVKHTIKVSSSITPAQGVTVSNYVCMFVSPNSGIGQNNMTMPLGYSPEYLLYCQMYDQLRVHSVTMKVIPRATQTESVFLAVESEGAAPAVTVGKNVFYTVEDRDGVAAASIATLKKYSSVKTHSCVKPMSRTYRVKYDGPNTWLDCQNRDVLNQITQTLGLQGGITLYGESFMENKNQILNSVWADLEVTYQLSFRGKALVGIAVGEDGSVTLSQKPLGSLEALQVFHSTDSIDHFGSVDVDGNTIGEFTLAPTGATGPSCDCTGPTGPAGEQGPAGETGPTGPAP